MDKLSKLPNIGKVLMDELISVGINTSEKLKKAGCKKAWLKLKENNINVCLSKLYALQGAIDGIRWHDLKEGVKKDLKEFYLKQNI